MTAYRAVAAALTSLPPGWSVAELRRVTTLRRHPNVAADQPLLSLSSAGVVAERDEQEGLGRQAPSDATIRDYWKVRPGQLVVNPMWLIGGSVGESRVCGAVSPAYRVYEPDPTIDSRYLHHVLRSYPYTEQYRLMGRGDTTFDRSVGREDLEGIPIPLAPLDEQRRIADFLDDQVTRIDQAIALRQRQVVGLGEALGAVAHERVCGAQLPGQAPTALPWATTLPATWRVARLSSIAQMGSGHTPSRSEPEYWLDCDIPWLTTGDVHKLRDDDIETLDTTTVKISDVGLRNSAAVRHPAGTVALSRTASAGFSIVMGVPMATSQDYVVWRPSPFVDPGFMLWCLRAMRRDLLGRLAMGSTHKTIYFPDLESIRIPLPPLDVQQAAVRAIRERVRSIVDARTTVRSGIALLQERRRALITAAVTGEFDVSSASSRAVKAVIA